MAAGTQSETAHSTASALLKHTHGPQTPTVSMYPSLMYFALKGASIWALFARVSISIIMYICIYVCMYICMYIYIHVHICMYGCI